MHSVSRSQVNRSLEGSLKRANGCTEMNTQDRKQNIHKAEKKLRNKSKTKVSNDKLNGKRDQTIKLDLYQTKTKLQVLNIMTCVSD